MWTDMYNHIAAAKQAVRKHTCSPRSSNWRQCTAAFCWRVFESLWSYGRLCCCRALWVLHRLHSGQCLTLSLCAFVFSILWITASAAYNGWCITVLHVVCFTLLCSVNRGCFDNVIIKILVIVIACYHHCFLCVLYVTSLNDDRFFVKYNNVNTM